MMGLVLGELFNFGRHTITQSLLGLRIMEGDWTAWYRLFSKPRFEEEQLNEILPEETAKGGKKMNRTLWLSMGHPSFAVG